MADQLEGPARELWHQQLQQERGEWIQEVEQVLKDDERMTVEIGDEKQQLEILVLLKNELDQYSHVLTTRELELASDVFDAVARRENVMVGRLPSWFAPSELEWFRAKKTVVEGGEEACERQAAVWAKLHHPNVRKFFGACHVGKGFVIHEACSELPLLPQNEPKRRARARKTRRERVIAETMNKSGARWLEKVTRTWGHILGCALGLQYVHDRGLVHEKLSVEHLLYSQASQRGVLSGTGLMLRQRITNTSAIDAGPSVSSDIFAFGLAVLQVIVLDRSPDSSHSIMPESLPSIRPEFIKPSEWNLLTKMCAPDPAERMCLADIVYEISVLAKKKRTAAQVNMPSNFQVVDNVSTYEIQSLGMTLEAALEEIEQLLVDTDDTNLRSVNYPVYDRLLDIYNQLSDSLKSPSLSLVESFSLIVLRLFDTIDQYALGSSCVVASICASSAVAAKNYNLHHDIDTFLRISNLQNTAPAHHWRPMWKNARAYQDDMLQSYFKNPEFLMSQLSNDDDRSEAITLLKFEVNSQLGALRGSLASAELLGNDDEGELPLWFIPPYQVQLGNHIADGSFGAVYEGEWLDTDVVVKQVLLDQTNKENREQFRREADLWFSLNHPNLIKLYGACHQGRPFFVCEPACHGTLAKYCRGKTRRTIWFAIGEAALGLQHLHDHEIVHRDIKGNNILICDSVDGSPTAKLADFGLSIVTNGKADSAPDDNGALGAFRWKAPECLQGAVPSFASDIYSLGMCIIEAITGQFPWGNTVPDSVVIHNVVIMRSLPPRLDCFSDDEWRLVTRMCRYEPHHRISIGTVINCAFNLAAKGGNHRTTP
ncbi:unnamed protein product [Phytophthora lilii]|uniref:Unnamed protein product n=1 Tax=Phytophthora lilii TaxID=2077276 RepID=A0A9W6TWI5_9STRA|nr:unnamed protein product [Phytophthora lilii]